VFFLILLFNEAWDVTISRLRDVINYQPWPLFNKISLVNQAVLPASIFALNGELYVNF